ncbi:SufD family Fe-S cluster assembly protein [archaeon]|nr:SufD family Fe-S cluster assembly protein [archaeon]
MAQLLKEKNYFSFPDWFQRQREEAERAAHELVAAPKVGMPYIDHSEVAKTKSSDATLTHSQISDGFTVMSLSRALQTKEHASGLSERMGLLAKPSEEKTQSFLLSKATDGVFLATQPETKSKFSLSIVPNNSSFQRNVVVVERDSSLELGIELTGNGKFLGQVTEVFVEEGSELRLDEIQNIGNETTHCFVTKVKLGKGARLHWNSCSLGSAKTIGSREVLLAGRGAESRNVEVVFARLNQQLSYDVKLNHIAGDTQSRLLVRSAVRDSARVFAGGLARIAPEAANSNSFVEEHALLLNHGARCEAIPSLEIENNSVRCSHSASVTNIDPEQVFYLQSRGISSEEARKQIALGFLSGALSAISDSRFKENAESQINKNWNSE